MCPLLAEIIVAATDYEYPSHTLLPRTGTLSGAEQADGGRWPGPSSRGQRLVSPAAG